MPAPDGGVAGRRIVRRALKVVAADHIVGFVFAGGDEDPAGVSPPEHLIAVGYANVAVYGIIGTPAVLDNPCAGGGRRSPEFVRREVVVPSDNRDGMVGASARGTVEGRNIARLTPFICRAGVHACRYRSVLHDGLLQRGDFLVRAVERLYTCDVLHAQNWREHRAGRPGVGCRCVTIVCFGNGTGPSQQIPCRHLVESTVVVAQLTPSVQVRHVLLGEVPFTPAGFEQLRLERGARSKCPTRADVALVLYGRHPAVVSGIPCRGEAAFRGSPQPGGRTRAGDTPYGASSWRRDIAGRARRIAVRHPRGPCGERCRGPLPFPKHDVDMIAYNFPARNLERVNEGRGGGRWIMI